MRAAPLFIIGIARSGTNLLARMLARHSAVGMALDPLMPVFKSLRNAVIAAHAPEAVARRFDAASAFQDYYFDADGPILLDALLSGSMELDLPEGERDALRSRVRDRAALESPPLGDRLTSLDGTTYSELLSSACAIIAGERSRLTWVGIKEVWIFEFIPMLARAFPSARFYAMDRDPRAIIASLVSMAGRDATQAAHVPSYLRHWRKSIALMRRFETDPALADRFRVVSYEQLACDPEPEARRICAELHLEYEPGMLSLSAEGWTGNSSFGEAPEIYSASAQRWRTVLDRAAIATADFLCGPEMRLTSYEPMERPALNEDVLAYLQNASRAPGSWRSDSGDPVVDVGGELLRLSMLGASVTPDESLVRRCFLFPETLQAIREAGATAVLMGRRGRVNER